MAQPELTEVYCGYLPQQCIFDLAKLPELFANHSILITCIDSTPTPFHNEWEHAKKEQWKMEVLANGYWIHQDNVQRVLTDGRALSLYSEIYAFKGSRKPASEDKPKVYTSDWCFFNQEVPSDFKRSFAMLDADLYLSDGAGVNYACASKGTMLLLERLSALPQQ